MKVMKKELLHLLLVVFTILFQSCGERNYECPEPLHCHICFIENDSCVVELNEKNIYKGSEIALYKDSALTIEKNINVYITTIVFNLDNDYTIKRNGKKMFCSDYYLKIENNIHTIHTEYSGPSCGKRLEKFVYDSVEITEEQGEISVILD